MVTRTFSSQSLGIGLLVAAVAWTVIAGAAHAAPPPNDDFANAAALGAPPTQATGDNTEATEEASEPGAHGKQSVWWKWTATAAGRFRADVCDTLPSADLAMGVYTGSAVNALTNVTAAGTSGNTEAPVNYGTGRCADEGHPAVVFDAVQGQTYYIAVGADSCCKPASPNIVLKLFKSAPNDNFAEAAAIAAPAQVAGSNTFASNERFEPGDHGRASVWWKWTADRAGRFRADTCATLPRADLAMGVYTGSAVNALTNVTAAGTSGNTEATVNYRNGRCADEGHPAVVFDAVPGQTYYIAVGSDSCCTPTSPNVVLRLFKSEPNDNFAEALPLAGHYASGRGSNVFASVEQFEPGSHGDSSVWWVWRAPQTGPFMIHTCGTLPAASTRARIYTGSAIGALAEVNGEVDDCGQRQGETLRFNAVEGGVYFFAVGAASCCTVTSPGVVLTLRDTDCDQTTRAFKKAKKKFKKAKKKFRRAKKRAKRNPTARNIAKRTKLQKKMKKKKRQLKSAKQARNAAC